MLRTLTVACLLLCGGCTAQLESSIAHHDARAISLEAAGDMDGALREREAAEHAKDKLSWRTDTSRDFTPPLTAF